MELKFFRGVVLLVIAIQMVAPAPGWAISTPVLTIRGAVDQALARNPNVTLQTERVDEGEGLHGQAVSAVFPTITASLTATEKKDASSGNPLFGGNSYNLYDSRVTLTQPIYAGGALTSGLGAANKERQIRALDLEISKRDTTTGVINAFYLVLVNQRKLTVLKDTRAVEKEAQGVAEYRRRIGRGQLLDVLQIKTQVSLLDSQIAQARSDLDSSIAALMQILSDHQSTSVEVRGSMDPDRIKSVVDRVRKQKFRIPEFERLSTLHQQTEDLTTVTLAKHWPTLNLVGYVDRTSYKKVDLLNDYSQSWNAALQLSIPLFSGLSSVSERRALVAREHQVAAQEQQTQNQFAYNEVKAIKDLEAAASIIESSRAGLGFARDSVKEAQRNFKLATIDYLQFLTVQQNYLNAEIANNQAEYAYIQAISSYMVASGHPLSELVDSLQMATGK